MEIPLVLSGITFILILMTVENTQACCGTQTRSGPGKAGMQGNWFNCRYLILRWTAGHFM